MADRGIEVVRAHLAKLPPADSLTIAERRAQYERAEKAFPIPPEVKVERVTAPVAPAEWLRPPSAEPGRVVLYLHGGGYVIGSPRSHRHLAAAIAGAAGARARLPAGGVCISPWVDLTFSGGSYQTKAAADPIVGRPGIDEMARAYLGATDPRTPLASPVFADLRGLPPLLIHVGSDEVLLDDAVQLAERAKAAGVPATLEVWDGMIHVWHWFLP